MVQGIISSEIETKLTQMVQSRLNSLSENTPGTDSQVNDAIKVLLNYFTDIIVDKILNNKTENSSSNILSK